jgi:hypothetical protein
VTLLSQREAARAWSIPWTTYRRKVQAGELSIGADKRVDPAEMVRVFGEPRPSSNGPVGTSIGPADEAAEVAQLKARLTAVEAMLEAKDMVIVAQGQTIEAQAAALRLLAAPPAEPTPEPTPEPGLWAAIKRLW